MRHADMASRGELLETEHADVSAGGTEVSTPPENAPWDSTLYVITLATASRPMKLHVPFVHELVGFSVFRSRMVEDGRERFRLHLGYFSSAARAHEALAVVRRYYPTAWISSAPRSSLGSLDDTLNADFQAVRRGNARVVKAEESPPTRPATGTETSKDAPVPAAIASEQQRYVVQLDASMEPTTWATIPRLAVFRAYHLYRVRTDRDSGPEHALRLGFFLSVDGAHQVAEHVRSHFPRVNVVPVSSREYERAMDLAHKRPAEGMADGAPANEPPAAHSGGPQPSPALDPQPAAPLESGARPERSRAELLALLGADRLEVQPDGDEAQDGNRESAQHSG
jgi:hypothetical protein